MIVDNMQIKVGYQTYDVEFVDHEVVNGDAVCYGDIDYQNLLIRVSTIYPASKQKTTLLHETIHALDNLFDIELTEKQTILLGNALAGLFTDNPEFLKLLKEENV